jgi:tetratricopeptide (TPR) repeat protein
MTPVLASPAVSKRGLLLHDGLAFVALMATTVTLFGVTLFLFRSFEGHRADLAREWAARGKTALAQRHPEAAVTALRTALSYAPETRADQFLLAQALADSGRTEEATNYFLTLWDATPGDGFINLQLARLARKKGETKEAADYYRASIFGSWEQNGAARRREVRLELIDFLTGQRELAEARNELFTVAGNAPNDAGLNLLVGEKLEAAEDSGDALSFYEKSIAAAPKDGRALELAGRLAYAMGNYAKAEDLLGRAVHLSEEDALKTTNEHGGHGEDTEVHGGGLPSESVARLLEDARRIQELTLTRDQPAGQRADHLLLASGVAQARLKSCAAQAGGTSGSMEAAGMVADLNAEWKTAMGNGKTNRRTLLENADVQDAWTQLVYRTEEETAKVCGAPTGDDALLLRLANGTLNVGTGTGAGTGTGTGMGMGKGQGSDGQ